MKIQWLIILTLSFSALGIDQMPNGHVYISERLVRLATNFKPIDRTSPIKEQVEGGTLTGNIQLTGMPSFEIIPNPKAATYLVSLKGKAASDKQTWRMGGASVVSSSETNFTIQKRLYFEGFKMTAGPAEITEGKSQIAINGSENKSISSIVAKTKAKREREAKEKLLTERVCAQVKQGLDEQAAASLSEGGTLAELRGFAGTQKTANPGVEPGLGSLTSESTDDYAIFHLNVPGKEFVPGGELWLYPRQHDLGMEIHETLVGNLLQAKFAGKPVTDNQMFVSFKTLMADEPYELFPHDRTERWQFYFADRGPVVMRFDNDRIDLTLQLKSWEITAPGAAKATVFQRPVRVSTRYRLAPREGRIEAVQEANGLSIDFVEREGVTAEEEKALDFLRTKFAAFFAPVWDFEGLEIPVGSSLERFNALAPSRYEAKDRWLRLGWTLE